jgi:hypothetical protein
MLLRASMCLVAVGVFAGCAAGDPPLVDLPAPVLTGEVCADTTAITITAADTARGMRLAQPRSILIPPPPRGVPDSDGMVRTLISTAGTVDSVEITGIPHQRYVAELTKNYLMWRFTPAYRGSCRTASWLEAPINIRRGSRVPSPEPWPPPASRGP